MKYFLYVSGGPIVILSKLPHKYQSQETHELEKEILNAMLLRNDVLLFLAIPRNFCPDQNFKKNDKEEKILQQLLATKETKVLSYIISKLSVLCTSGNIVCSEVLLIFLKISQNRIHIDSIKNNLGSTCQ